MTDGQTTKFICELCGGAHPTSEHKEMETKRRSQSGINRDTISPELKYQETAEDIARLMIFAERRNNQPVPFQRDKRIALEAEWIQSLRDQRQRMGKPEHGGEPDFFGALRAHENSNDRWQGQFISAYLPEEAQDLYHKPITDLSREEWRALYDQFPQKEVLEHEEADAIKAYRWAVKEWWRLRRVDTYDARILLNDLLFRQASRIEDIDERDKAQEQLMEDLKQLIADLKLSKSTPEEAVKNFGRSAEVEVMYLFRLWLRKNGLDHVISIEHSLPRDDQQFGIDFLVRVGSEEYKLDQKTFKRDDYQREFQSDKIASAEESIHRSGGHVFQVDPTQLDAGIKDAVKGKINERAVAHILQRIASVMPPDIAALFEKKAVAKERSVSRVKDKDIENLVGNVKFLLDAGFLYQTDKNNLSRILAVKKKIFPIIQEMIRSKRIKTLDELRASADLQKEIRRAMADSPVPN